MHRGNPERLWQEQFLPEIKNSLATSPVNGKLLQRVRDAAQKKHWPPALTAAVSTAQEAAAIADQYSQAFPETFSKEFFTDWYLFPSTSIMLVIDALKGQDIREFTNRLAQTKRGITLEKNKLDKIISLRRKDVQIYLDDRTGFKLVDSCKTPAHSNFLEEIQEYPTIARQLIIIGGERYKQHFLHLQHVM